MRFKTDMGNRDFSKRYFLIAAIIFAALAVCCCALLAVPVGQYNDSFKSYDDFKSVTYTYQSRVYYGGRNDYYEFSVKQELKPLRVEGNYLSALNKEELSSLKNGDKIYCYVRKSLTATYDYELVEIKKGSTVIMSLEDYNAAGRENAIIGLCVISVTAVACVAVAIWYFVNYKRKK